MTFNHVSKSRNTARTEYIPYQLLLLTILCKMSSFTSQEPLEAVNTRLGVFSKGYLLSTVVGLSVGKRSYVPCSYFNYNPSHPFILVPVACI